uniref:Uncharacterized protein n=1 Tax=Anguilla anguilla TaxID=7936 RepID=A0A0E9VC16_ANGAN
MVWQTVYYFRFGCNKQRYLLVIQLKWNLI